MSMDMKQVHQEKNMTDTMDSEYLPGQWGMTAEAGHDSWVLSLSDLMTLMLIFFLIWTTMKMTRRSVPADLKTSTNITEIASVKDIEGVMMKMVPVTRHQGNLMIVLQGDLSFPDGSALLSGPGRGILAKIASILRHQTGYELDIIGHTDRTPVSPTGKWNSNTELSLARAASVFNALAEYGISPVRMKVQGLGALFPVRAEDGNIINSGSRRVEIIIRPAARRATAKAGQFAGNGSIPHLSPPLKNGGNAAL